MTKQKKQLMQLGEDLKQASQEHKAAKNGLNKARSHVQQAYERQHRALRELSDETRAATASRIGGGPSIEYLESLESEMREGTRDIERRQGELRKAEERMSKAEARLPEARKAFTRAYHDYAAKRFPDLEKALEKAAEINEELWEFGSIAWAHAHIHPVAAKIGHGDKSNADIRHVLTPARNTLKRLKGKVA